MTMAPIRFHSFSVKPPLAFAAGVAARCSAGLAGHARKDRLPLETRHRVLQPPSPEDVLRQAKQHTDAGRREAEMPIDALREVSGDERTNERAEVDAHVEQGESGVAARVPLPIERADERAHVRLQQAGADDDQAQAGVEEGSALNASVKWPAAMTIPPTSTLRYWPSTRSATRPPRIAAPQTLPV